MYERPRPILHIAPDGDDGYLLAFEFDEDFKDDLKDCLPRHARRWRPEHRAWWVDSLWLDGALQLAENHFTIVEERKR